MRSPSRRTLCTSSLLWPFLWGCGHARRDTSARDWDTGSVRRFGAIGDGQHDDTAAIQAALDACTSRGGGTVFVPAGLYLVRPLVLGSRTRLVLESGSVLRASTRIDDYPKRVDPWTGQPATAGLLTAFDATDVAIVGGGALDGSSLAFTTTDLGWRGTDHDPKLTRQGEGFMAQVPFPDGPFRKGERRPGNVLRLHGCRRVLIEGITIRNSPTWNVRMSTCRDVRITGVDINSRDSGLRIANDDGLDFQDCTGVRISDCDIETGDDCIAVFGSQDLTMTNCRLRSRSTAVRVGYDGDTPLRACTFSNLVIRDSNRGLGVFVRGASDVEDVLFSNCVVETRLHTGRWWGKGEPIHVSAVPWDPKAKRWGQLRGVRFEGIRATSPAGILLWGSDECVLRDVSLDDVSLHVKRDPLHESYGGNFDLRLARDPGTNLFAHDIPGLYARMVERLRVRNFDVRWDEGLPAWCGAGVEVERFDDVVVDGFDGTSAAPARTPALVLRDGRRSLIRGAVAAPGTAVFLEHAGLQDAPVLVDNEVRGARVLVRPTAASVR